ncbi:CAP domain-containing protein [Cellulomonas sp. GbtcB1]|uniref:CAP domain-containing protein n=1 Tax=Cellulomonas sp. GbtcB1 TaxID=2824746 RepID=UPI001C304E55|nr:CAP domain-containing protein [Cellulomonas sp. GbtcB1]
MTQRLWITSTVTAGLLLGSTAPALAADAPATAGTTTTPVAAVVPLAAADVEAAEQAILDRTNALRASEGKPALVRNAQIDAVAAAWAEHMATTGQFQHNPDFFRQIPAGWRTAGENIAMNSYDPVALYTQWQNSPPHRANMVNPAFDQIGISVVEHGGLYYGVQVFGGY